MGVVLTLLIAGCEGSDVVCSTGPLSGRFYEKSELMGEWLLELEVIDDASGRLAPGPLGAPERVWVPVPEEDFLYVRSREADALRAMVRVHTHVDGYRADDAVCIRPIVDELPPWWQRGLMRVDWTTDVWGRHPALASDEERERLAIESVPFFSADESGWAVRAARFERDEAGELTRISLAFDYLVTDRACADCEAQPLLVRFTLTRPPV